MADTQNAADQAEKQTFLILRTGQGEIFLEKADSEKAGTYFKNGPLHAFLGTNREGELTGAINLQIGVPKNGEEGYENVSAGALFRKEGSKGAFLSGYVGGVKIIPGEKEGVQFINLEPVRLGEDEKPVDVVNVTADIRGPRAEAILAAMPVVPNKNAKTAEATEAEAEPEKTVSRKQKP